MDKLEVNSFEDLRKIWTDEGANPPYHRRQQEQLRKGWPALYKWMVDNFGPPRS